MSLDLPRPERARLKLWLRMLKATRQVEGALRERLRVEFGSTLPRFDVMSALERRPEGLKMSELSRMLMVSNGNVTGIVDRLVAEGLAERADLAGDRRATLVRLTEAGTAQFAAMAAEHARWVDALMAGLDDAEVERTAAALARLARSAR